MTFAEDIRTLLTEELSDTDAESALYGALLRSPLLVEFVRALVETRDVDSLRALCHDTVELHELTERYGFVAGALPTPTEAPYHGCGPVTGAVRAVASLGLVLVDEEERLGEHLGIALAWLAHTRATVGAPWPPGRTAPACAHSTRMAAVIRALGADPQGTTAVVWLLGLQDALARKGATAAVEVLLDRGDSGIRATLRCTTLRRLPDALVPDPASMVLFTADARFRSGLETAWQIARAPRHKGGTVLWSLRDADGPVDHVQDISLTAAFTVLIDEMRRLSRSVRGPFTLRRLGGSTAIIGGVDDEGHMVSVSGYRNKFGASADLDRVVVPTADLEQARDHSRALQTSVVGARKWRDAARRSRRPDRRARLRVLLVCLVVLLAGSGGAGYLWQRQQRIQELRDTAAKVRDEAYELGANSDPELGLLLAMASDDIANAAGQKTDVFDSMARDKSSLRRILRPEEGQFEEMALSRDGAWGALSTSTGAVQILSTLTGETAWRQKGSGATLPGSGGALVSDLAVSRRGQRVAFASTDLRLTVLENRNSSWSVMARPALPIAPRPGPLRWELNAIDHLEFTADGGQIVAYSDRVGLFVFDAKHPDHAPKRCPERGMAKAMSATKGEVLLTKEKGTKQKNEVVRIDLTTCARSVVLTAPKDVVLHGAVKDDTVVAAATREAQLLALQPDGSETLLSNRGPYWTVSISDSDSGVHLSAATESGTFGWDVARRTQKFGLPKGGEAVISNGIVLRHRGEVAELYDDQRSLATTAWTRFYGGLASAAWAKDVLVLSGGGAVYVVPRAAAMTSKTFSDPASAHRLVLPKGVKSRALATTKDGPWAAVVYGKDGDRTKELAVWNVVERRRTPVPLPKGAGPNRVAFVGRDLYVGHNDGDVLRFRFRDGAWRSAGGRRLAGSVVALGSGEKADRLYAVVSKNRGDQPTVVGLRSSDLAVTSTRRLDGLTGLVEVAVMNDGQVVVGSGTGLITFLTPELHVRGRTSDGTLRYVLDLTDLTDRGQVLVSGENRSIVLDRNTLAAQEAWKHGAPFLSSDVSADGKTLATYSFTSQNVTLWTLDEPNLRARVCRAVGRELSREEWRQYVGTGLPYSPVCQT
jgi:WD40 repeat protein/predicted GNAT superfamily acetyltransferase